MWQVPASRPQERTAEDQHTRRLTAHELGLLSWAAASHLVRCVVRRAHAEHMHELQREESSAPDLADAKHRACLLPVSPRELHAELLALAKSGGAIVAPRQIDVSACILLTGWSSTDAAGWPKHGARPLGFEHGAAGYRYLRLRLIRGSTSTLFLFDADGAQLSLQPDGYSVAPK